MSQIYKFRINKNSLPLRFFYCHVGPTGSARYMIERALEYKANAVIIGWTVTNDILLLDGYPKFRRKGKDLERAVDLQRRYRELTSLAKEKGLDVYFTTPELWYPPGFFDVYPDALDPAKETLWEFLRYRVNEWFELMPDLDGFEIYLDEGAVNLLRINSRMSMSDRVFRLAQTTLDVCKKWDKKFMLCTFTRWPRELQAIIDGLQRVPRSDHLIVHNWCLVDDWGLTFPDNPAIGNVGGHPEVISFDVHGERHGSAMIPWCYPDWIKEKLTLDMTISPNVIGVAHKMHGFKLFISPTEANVYALARLALDPNTHVGDIWREWGETRYGEAWESVVSALKRTPEITTKIFYYRGVEAQIELITKTRARLEPKPSPLTLFKWQILIESAGDWDPKLRAIENEFLNATEERINLFLREKDEAIDLVKRSLSDIEKARGKLKVESYNALHKGFSLELELAKAHRIWTEIWMLYEMWWQHGRGEIETKRLRAALQSFSSLADELGSKGYGVENIRGVIEEIIAMMKQAPTMLRDWWVLGPLENFRCLGFLEELAPEKPESGLLENPEKLVYRQEHTGAMPSREPEDRPLRWIRYDAAKNGFGWVNINELAKPYGPPSQLFYMMTHVYVPTDIFCTLKAKNDDGIKIWVGGNTILNEHKHSSWGHSFVTYSKKVKFEKGWNRILVKAEKNHGHWNRSGVMIRITDDKGNPLKGIRCSASPTI